MATATKRTHKHFQVDSANIKRVQRALHAKTETEAIEHALDCIVAVPGHLFRGTYLLGPTNRFENNCADLPGP